MRLIDAKQTKREITKYLEECIDNNKIEIDVTELQIRIFGIINNQPTAYDPEALVAELEEQKVRYKNIRNNTHCIITETSECDSCRADHYLDARLNCVDRAIEIVRKGGVE